MSDEQTPAKTTNETGALVEERSPSEKLNEEQPKIVPGAENPASKEIKRETNFNTE